MSTEVVRSRISASKPLDWYAKESLTLYAADGSANVIASSEPLDLDIDSLSYALSQGDLLRDGFAGYAEHSFEAMEVFGGRPGCLRRFSWQPEDGEPVTQIQLYYAADGVGFTATATTTTADYLLYEPTLVDLLLSLRV